MTDNRVSPDDDELIALDLAGQESGSEELVKRYLADIRSFIYRKVKNSTVAEELTQDTFFKAFANIRNGNYHSNGKFKNYLFRIAQNTVIDYFRKKNREAEVVTEIT